MPARIQAALLFAGALLAAFILYAPSLNGDFVFDDRTLPMLWPDAASAPLAAWLGARPLLMATYFFNFHTTGLERFEYHAVNVVLHAACAVLIFFALGRLLEWSGIEEKRRRVAALLGAALFLVHPMQTEAVSYIASRSETLSVFFFLSALNVFLYRRKREVTFGTAAIVLLLYACAMSCKEHTAMLLPALLLTDYFFNPGFSLSGIRRNWKLYIPVAVLAAGGMTYIARNIGVNSNLGFSLKDFNWYQYLFTEFRAILVYLRMFLLPYGQSVDYDFPISHGILEHGALICGVALLAMTGAAIYFRKRFPAACYGFLLTLILLAPTSSILPIHDPLVDRRLYLPFIGLALIACDLGLRIRWQPKMAVAALSAVLILFAGMAYRRNGVWLDMQTLWEDAVSKNPENSRALMGLGDSYAIAGRCTEAIPYFQRAANLKPQDYKNTYNLASAYDCVNDISTARRGYQDAIAIKPTAEAWAHIAMIQMKTGQFDAAFQSFAKAQVVDPSYILTYTYRGMLLLALSRFDDAEAEFRYVLIRAPGDPSALRGVDRARNHERQF